MSHDYGTAVIHRRDDGRPVVTEADETIGIAVSLLAEPPDLMRVDTDGCVLLAGDPAYRYRPVRFDAYHLGGPPTVVVCERVR